jgi:hypothetical protein
MERRTTGEATPEEMDEAYDRVLAKWGFTYDEWHSDDQHDCRNGHFDCSYRQGGPCMNEEAARLIDQVMAENDGGTR